MIPLNIALAGEQVLFRLRTGAALAAIYNGQVAALEADVIDLDAQVGWSVNAVGSPVEVLDKRYGAQEQRIRSWLRSENTWLFSLNTDHVEGRRLLLERIPPSHENHDYERSAR